MPSGKKWNGASTNLQANAEKVGKMTKKMAKEKMVIEKPAACGRGWWKAYSTQLQKTGIMAGRRPSP